MVECHVDNDSDAIQAKIDADCKLPVAKCITVRPSEPFRINYVNLKLCLTT